ncbi:MAG: glycine betaine/L-proline ABC transporter ATP-binding protein [Oscillospiraceae bacterium]
MEDNVISVSNVSKLYGINKTDAVKLMKQGKDKDIVYKQTGVTVALWDVSFNVKRGEIFVIIGLSGSGKSTMIRCLNMLNKPTYGDISFDGKEIVDLTKKELIDYRRNKISMVFQNFGLMSHRDVLSNVAYGLEVKKIPKAEREEKATQMLSMVGLEGLDHQPITSLSGGMRQRVGIARALANDPEILLMDEPFSALDPLVRKDMQFELLSIQRKLEKTVIFITHDIDEAFKLGDTVAIMRDGKIVQIDSPENMSTNPADDYVRKFIDSADKTKVLSAKHIMMTPTCIIRLSDTCAFAIQQMKLNGVSSAYAVDKKMRLQGIVTIDAAVKCKKDNLPLVEAINSDVLTASEDTLISDILPIAAEAKFPIAVIDEDNKLKGIVSKASVLSSLS